MNTGGSQNGSGDGGQAQLQIDHVRVTRTRTRLTARLGKGTLRLEAEVTNPDTVPLPFGLGYHPYFLADTQAGGLLGLTSQPFADPARSSEVTTPWVTYPDFVEAECVTAGDFTYLALTVNGDPADPRTDDIKGEWGLHIVDANIAMGDIESLVASQAEAYVG